MAVVWGWTQFSNLCVCPVDAAAGQSRTECVIPWLPTKLLLLRISLTWKLGTGEPLGRDREHGNREHFPTKATCRTKRCEDL